MYIYIHGYPKVCANIHNKDCRHGPGYVRLELLRKRANVPVGQLFRRRTKKRNCAKVIDASLDSITQDVYVYRLSREEFKELIVQAEVIVTPIIIIY